MAVNSNTPQVCYGGGKMAEKKKAEKEGMGERRENGLDLPSRGHVHEGCRDDRPHDGE